ncbi:MAG: exonuclease SbcCD subunit D [Roseiflexus sp.]|nr:exonuclease SbcCD subunit D [Roseiflexus sp.]MCS7291057.1 exonuclease SbcCD subunit D [Roseiflexus sp.]MDW8145815.1 exonuclease SbcCD subunit D [Roseiflexaceae bacterium]MDW8232942.1 exonuclease SbcCD subunit D [Roseiflexaceae bacterium]
MRLLHLADLHIGIENYGRVDPATGLHTRLRDYLERFDEAIEIGLAEGVDAVLIAGDIYKNRTPNPTQQREFARRIHRLRACGLPVFILTGNHDVSPAAGRAHTVEIFDTLAVDGVTIADRPRIHTLHTRSGPLQIIALPWVTRHALLTKEELRMASFLEIETMLIERVERFLRQAAEDLDPALPAVLTVHGTIDGAIFGAERQVLLGRDLVYPRSLVTLPGVDYVAMGHIHRHQALGDHPPIVYPGSIERIDFGEENEDKGCVIVDLAAKGDVRWHFHKLTTRPFVTIAVDVRGVNDPMQRVLAAIERRSLRGAVVRVKVDAHPEQADLIQTEAIRRALDDAGAYVIAAVAVEVERSTRGRLGGNDASILDGLTPRRALELYLRQKTPPLSEERIAALLAAADELLAEREGTAP